MKKCHFVFFDLEKNLIKYPAIKNLATSKPQHKYAISSTSWFISPYCIMDHTYIIWKIPMQFKPLLEGFRWIWRRKLTRWQWCWWEFCWWLFDGNRFNVGDVGNRNIISVIITEAWFHLFGPTWRSRLSLPDRHWSSGYAIWA